MAKRSGWQELASPVPAPKPPPPERPEVLVRRELKRQKTLAVRKAQAPAPDPADVRVRTELCPIKGFTCWTECAVPIHVVLLRDWYADGHQSQWALMSTADLANPPQPKDQYDWRTQIEERHRLLKCCSDLSDFRSGSFNVVAAQVVFIVLSYTLRQWQLWRLSQESLAGQTPGFWERRLNRRKEYGVIYHQQAYTQMPLLSFSRELLELSPEAQAQALLKLRQLEQSPRSPLEHRRAPP